MNYGNAQANASRTDIPGSPVRQTEVQTQVERGQKVTACIGEQLDTLHNRLQPLLRSTSSGQTGAEPPKPTLVGHAQALSNHNDQLEGMSRSLGDILDRLEF